MILSHSSKKARTPIGLDIGARGLRAAQIVRVHDRWSVVATGTCGRGSREDGRSQTLPSPQLARIVTTPERFSGRRVIAAISSPDVEYFALELPEGVLRSEEPKLAQVVGAEVGRLMGPGAEDPVTRYWRSPGGKAPSPNVVGVGTSAVTVLDLLARLDEARLDCTVVEPSGAALVRLGTVLRPPGDDELWGMVDLGERQCRLVLCHGEVLVLARSIGVGVGQWLREIAEALDVSIKSAEVHLREHGVAAGGGHEAGERRARRDSLSGMMMGALRSHLRSTIAEVRRSVAYLRQCYPGRTFSGLIAVGGGSVVPNVVEYLAGELGSEIGRASAFLQSDRCGLTYSSGHGQWLELVAVAVGAALSS